MDDRFNEYGELREDADHFTPRRDPVRSRYDPVRSQPEPINPRTNQRSVAVVAILLLTAGFFIYGAPGHSEMSGYDLIMTLISDRTSPPSIEYEPAPEDPVTPDWEPFSLKTRSYERVTYSIPVTLTSPPLRIKYSVTPEMATHEKMEYSGPFDKTGKLIRYTYPSEFSWFEITVRDEEGKVVIQDGFGFPPGAKSGYGQKEGDFKVLVGGNYIIDIRFNNMLVDINIG